MLSELATIMRVGNVGFVVECKIAAGELQARFVYQPEHNRLFFTIKSTLISRERSVEDVELVHVKAIEFRSQRRDRSGSLVDGDSPYLADVLERFHFATEIAAPDLEHVVVGASDKSTDRGMRRYRPNFSVVAVRTGHHAFELEAPSVNVS